MVIGFASGTIQKIPANYLLLKNCSAVGAYWGPYLDKQPSILLDSLSKLVSWIEAGKLAPHISAKFSLDDCNEALRLLYERKATGKVMLMPR